MNNARLATCWVALGLAASAQAQSLLLRPAGVGGGGGPAIPPASPAPTTPPTPAIAAGANAGQASDLAAVSLFAINPPKPKVLQKNDKIEIIINETALQSHEQKLDSKKQYNLSAELSQFPSIAELIKNITLRDGIGGDTPNVGVKSNSDFKGDGKYERKDRFTARLSALVTEVKPNGLLLVEAKEVMQSDEEIKTMVVSGLVDPKDITTSGTVLSTQLAGLTIRTLHEGQVKDASEKGLIPRIFETIFNF